jgi:tetratricopeptide (TPR) repeat protein
LSRLTRHEILKEDKFLTTVEKSRYFLIAWQKQLLLGLAVTGIVALLAFGGRYYFVQQDVRAKDDLSQALKIYHEPNSLPLVTVSSGDLSLSGDKQRFEKALPEFQKVSSSHASRPAGKIAKYYAGLCLKGLNKNSEAIATLEPLSKDKSDYGVLAQVALSQIYENIGNLVKATEVYQQLVTSESAVAPKGISLIHLAQLYEQQNKSAEAAKTYQQVIKEFPGTPYMGEAEQKIKQLSR